MRVSPLRSFLFVIVSRRPSARAADAQSLVSPLARKCTGDTSGRSAAAADARSRACRRSRTSFYITFDNGGVWRSTDFGSNWFPLFDDQSTGRSAQSQSRRPIRTSST